jgi:hypothetical protein
LKEAPVVELDDEDLAAFAPGASPRQDGSRPYLVRGLALLGTDGKPLGTSGFIAYRRGDELWVECGALGYYDCGMTRAPLVIWLPSRPEVVYLSVSRIV